MTVTNIIIVSIFILLVLLAKNIRVVKKDEVRILERFNKFHRILNPGVHFVIPLISKTKSFPWQYSYEENGKLIIRNIQTDSIYLEEQGIHLFKDINTDKKLLVTIILKVEDPIKMAYEPLLFKKLGENIDNSFKYSVEGLKREDVQENPKQYYETMLEKLNTSIKDLGCKVSNLKIEEIDSNKLLIDNTQG